MKVVDLFSGCGGFGLGAKLAGFEVCTSIDIDPQLQSAYRLNFPTTKAVTGDLSLMDEASWKLLIGHDEVDGVIGGPPCQGYSRIGKQNPDDPRRSLIFHFFRCVNILKPKFFVMENVEGLLDPGSITELHAALSTVDNRYHVLDPITADASHFGAPTKRKRVLIVGYNPCEMERIDANTLIPTMANVNSVSDAIRDLPSPIKQPKDKTNFGWAQYSFSENDDLSPYARIMRGLPDSRSLGWTNAKEQLKAGFTSGHFETRHTAQVINRFSQLKPGQIDKTSKAKRLDWDGVCPTLRAGTGSDKGSFQSVRPIHPEEPRVITVREAARLQGFPDWFTFHPTKWHSFRMIGNSVSPLLSESILSTIGRSLDLQSEIDTANIS
ncbi:MAG: DNA cytosine methyltransferase [Oleiphilaceae bacterium]|nr:DNA cytosine methyltransferase [Oleiphilaceae bacterium]